MRLVPLLAGLSLALALVSIAPGADARREPCEMVDCSASPCIETPYADVCTDRCTFQSDCCATSQVWCPETE